METMAVACIEWMAVIVLASGLALLLVAIFCSLTGRTIQD